MSKRQKAETRRKVLAQGRPAAKQAYRSFRWIDEPVPQDDWRVVEARGPWFYVGPYQGKWWVMKHSDPTKVLPVENDLFSADDETGVYDGLDQCLLAGGLIGQSL